LFEPTFTPISPVTSSFSVPIDVKKLVVTLAGIAVPVSVLAAAGTVMFAVPSKGTPLIVLAVSNLVAVLELPLILRPIISLASIKFF